MSVAARQPSRHPHNCVVATHHANQYPCKKTAAAGQSASKLANKSRLDGLGCQVSLLALAVQNEVLPPFARSWAGLLHVRASLHTREPPYLNKRGHGDARRRVRHEMLDHLLVVQVLRALLDADFALRSP